MLLSSFTGQIVSLLMFAVLGHMAVAQMVIGTQKIGPDVQMPVVMMGTWTSGTTEDAGSILSTWINQGGRGIDEAIAYENQPLAAQAMQKSGVPRSSLFIETKIPGCGGESLARSWIETCLSDLSTQYLDLLLIHAPQGPDCLGTWRVMEEYHARGILKSIGVSNFQIPHLQNLLAHAKVVPAVNQIQFNVFYHNDALAAFCKDHGIIVQSWGPLGGAHHWFHRSVFTEPTISSIAQAHQVTNAQVALRWVLQHVPTLVVLSGSKAHQRNDADVFNFDLSLDEMARLDALQHSASTAQKSDASLPSIGAQGFQTNFVARTSGTILLLVGVSSIAGVAMIRILARLHFQARATGNAEDLEFNPSVEPMD